MTGLCVILLLSAMGGITVGMLLHKPALLIPAALAAELLPLALLVSGADGELIVTLLMALFVYAVLLYRRSKRGACP